MRNKWFLCFLLFALIFVHGCQSSTDSGAKDQKPVSTKEQKQPPKQEAPIPVEVPKELEGIHVLAGPGKYAGDRYDENKVKSEIDRFPKNLTPEEYYQKVAGTFGGGLYPLYPLLRDL